jgi:hypothetical protein
MTNLPNEDAVDPEVAPPPNAVNDAAIRIVQSYGTGELARVQTRGEKWIAGITALSGLVTAALVVKGKDSFAKLDPSYEPFGCPIDPVWWVAGALALAYVCYGTAIFSSYAAAFGNPLAKDELETLEKKVQTNPATAATELRNAVATKADNSRSSLRRAIWFTLAAMVMTAIAVGITWRVPDKSTGSTPVCLEVGSEGQTTTLRFDGSLPEIKSGTYRVVACD